MLNSLVVPVGLCKCLFLHCVHHTMRRLAPPAVCLQEVTLQNRPHASHGPLTFNLYCSNFSVTALKNKLFKKQPLLRDDPPPPPLCLNLSPGPVDLWVSLPHKTHVSAPPSDPCGGFGGDVWLVTVGRLDCGSVAGQWCWTEAPVSY